MLRFEYKFSSDLTSQDVGDILRVLNATFMSEIDEATFRWMYFENPYGDSLHMIAYDDSLSGDHRSVGSMGFWRNDLDGASPSYQCVDLAMIPSHQRRGIFRETLCPCVECLSGAYLYTFPNFASQPGFQRGGWSVNRKIPISVHQPAGVLKKYAERGSIPDIYAEWRFAKNPQQQY